MTASGRVSELTGDERLLAELLRGRPLVQAAEIAGVPERTARRRLSDEKFAARLEEGRRSIAAEIAASVAGAEALGFSVLLDQAGDANALPFVRQKAALALIGLAHDRTVGREVAERLDKLELVLEQRPLKAVK